MITIREYARPATLEEAWQLNQKRPNRVLGGMLWLKMEKISVGTAIDLSALGLDTIEETDTEFAIGAMATLRSLETHAALNAATNGAMREAVRHIVGVQFRNCATVGGSVYGRFGFSDVLTLLLALDCDVELYKAGRMPIAQFAALPYDRDILTHVYIKKTPGLAVHYQSVRATQTDFPILTCAAARTADGAYRFAIGARPMKAMLVCPTAAPDELPAAVQAAVRNRAFVFEGHSVFGSLNGKNGNDFVDDFCYIEVFFTPRNFVSIELAHVKHVVDEFEKIRACVHYFFATFGLFFKVACVILAYSDHALYAVYRRAYIVAHSAQKVAFGFVGAYGFRRKAVKLHSVYGFAFFALLYSDVSYDIESYHNARGDDYINYYKV